MSEKMSEKSEKPEKQNREKFSIDERKWRDVGVGLSVLDINEEAGRRLQIVRLAPNGRILAHVNHGTEVVYVVKGWVKMEYEGIGKILMKAGSCFYQPPRIRHRELAHSKNVEMIEVVAPANFKTYAA